VRYVASIWLVAFALLLRAVAPVGVHASGAAVSPCSVVPTDAAGALTGLTTTISGTTSLSETLTNNLDGDRTGWTDSVSGQSAALSYDQADRLTGVAGTGVPTPTTYAYDGDGLRMSSTTAITTSQAFWDPSQAAPSLLQEGTTSYLTGPGSVRGLVDATGAVQDSYSYDPYGQRTAITGSVGATPFGYAGAYTDSATGYSYLQARYYDPATAQFLSRDPLAALTGSPYSYIYDNPLNGTDPTGLACGFDLFCIAAGTAQDTASGAGSVIHGTGTVITTAVHGAQAGVTWTANTLGTAGNDAASATLGQIAQTSPGRAVLSGVLTLDRSDFSRAVNGDVSSLTSLVSAPLRGTAYCAQNLNACQSAAVALGSYLATHKAEVLTSLASGAANAVIQIPLEIACGQYGAAAGHTLVSFTLLGAGGLAATGAEAGAGGATVLDQGTLDATTGDAAAQTADSGSAGASDAGSAGNAGSGAVSPCGHCFPAGTLVDTPKGEQPIQTLQVGDQVLAENPTTGKVAIEPVQAVWTDPVLPMVAVALSDGSTIKATADHPFYVDKSAVRDQAGWVAAGQLRVGDRLRTERGMDVAVASMRANAGRAVVYTLTVATDHTFFVGTARVLVHNSTCPTQSGVYVLRDPTTGEVMRTGRASNLAKRRSDHANAPSTRDLVFETQYVTANYAEQRGLEQLLYDQYPNAPLNFEAPISTKPYKAAKRLAYLQAAQAFLERLQNGE